MRILTYAIAYFRTRDKMHVFITVPTWFSLESYQKSSKRTAVATSLSLLHPEPWISSTSIRIDQTSLTE